MRVASGFGRVGVVYLDSHSVAAVGMRSTAQEVVLVDKAHLALGFLLRGIRAEEGMSGFAVVVRIVEDIERMMEEAYLCMSKRCNVVVGTAVLVVVGTEVLVAVVEPGIDLVSYGPAAHGQPECPGSILVLPSFPSAFK